MVTHEELRKAVQQIPDVELEQVANLTHISDLLSKLGGARVRFVPVRGCKEHHVVDILGLDTENLRHTMWDICASVANVTPSNWFLNSYARWRSCWRPTCEYSTRTLIDLVLLEIASHNAKEYRGNPVVCIGAVTLKYRKDNATIGLSGIGDYFLGYSNLQKPKPHELLIVGEAKACGEPRLQWQIIGYMGMIHQARKKENKSHSTVYGFLTDSNLWSFYRIDDESVVWESKVFDFRDPNDRNSILACLTHLVQCAQQSTPSCSRVTSVSQLEADMDMITFPTYVEKFLTVENGNSQDEELEGEVFIDAEYGRGGLV